MKNSVPDSKALPRSRLDNSALRLTPLAAALAAGLFALPSTSASAATIAVVNGGCTLIDAITAANSDTATGLCPAGSGADTITLPANSTQTLTAVNINFFGDTGLPVITSEILMVGNGSTILRDPTAPNFRLLAVDSGGDIHLQNTTLSGGSTSGDGGAIASQGSVTLTDSTVSGNSGDNGGGIANFGGSLGVFSSTVSGNFSAGAGGGIHDGSGTISLVNSTVSGNIASSAGGGIYGGGDAVTVIDSTVAGNTGGQSGGGLFFFGSTVTLTRSLITGNTSPNGREIFNVFFSGITANNFNLFGFNGSSGIGNLYSSFSPGATDIVPAAALADILGPLGTNGGPTQTHALVAGGPAIDAAGTTCSATDQRGVNRPKGAACDIGAFEVGVNTADLSIIKTASAPSVQPGGSLTFTLAVTNNGPESATDVQVVDGLPAQLTFVSATPTQGSCALVPGSVTCDLSGMASGAAASIALVTTAGMSGSVSNTASVISAPIIDFDPNSANNESTATVQIQDTTPNAFVFVDQTNVPRNSVRRSNAVTITGITAPAPISIVGGGYSIGCTGTFTATASTISNGQTVCVAHTSASTFNSGVNTILTVGGVSDTFTSVTAPNGIAALLGVTFQVLEQRWARCLGCWPAWSEVDLK